MAEARVLVGLLALITSSLCFAFSWPQLTHVPKGTSGVIMSMSNMSHAMISRCEKRRRTSSESIFATVFSATASRCASSVWSALPNPQCLHCERQARESVWKGAQTHSTVHRIHGRCGGGNWMGLSRVARARVACGASRVACVFGAGCGPCSSASCSPLRGSGPRG
jgi:hypothetical protein